MNLVKLTDLDDYLTPAQDCIVLDSQKSKAGKAKLNSIEDELSMKKVVPKTPNLIKQKAGETKATVNLYDCLACSGCVTSSEVILMEVDSIHQATRRQELCHSHGKFDGRHSLNYSSKSTCS